MHRRAWALNYAEKPKSLETGLGFFQKHSWYWSAVKFSKFEHSRKQGFMEKIFLNIILQMVVAMMFGFRVEDELDGVANFSP